MENFKDTIEVKKDTSGVDEALDAGMDYRSKSIEDIKNMVSDPNSKFNQSVKKFDDLVLARADAQASIDEMVSDPNSDFNKKREQFGNMPAAEAKKAEAPASIEEKVAAAKQYVTELKAMLGNSESVMADAVVGVEIQKVKDDINSGIDTLIEEVRPTEQNSDPLVSSRAGVLINDLEALKM